MGRAHFIPLKNTTIHGIKNAMDRKNINRGFKKLRVWQDAISLYVLALLKRIESLQKKQDDKQWQDRFHSK